MSVIRYSYNQDYNAADSTLKATVYDVHDHVQISYRAANGAADAVYIYDPDTGEAHFATDNRGAHSVVTASEFSFLFDYRDNIADVTLAGGAFGDSILGGSGNDYLQGQGGADTLVGGGGSDTLIAEGGDDALFGGAGADTFKFTFGAGADARIATVGSLNAGDVVNLDLAALNFGVNKFVAVDQFDHGANEISAVYHAGNDRTVFRFDFDGNGRVDHKIIVLGGDYSDYSQVTSVDTTGLSPAMHDPHALVV